MLLPQRLRTWLQFTWYPKNCMFHELKILHLISNKVDITEVPDFNKMYELYDPCTVMFFYRNKHMMIDLGTGNNNKNILKCMFLYFWINLHIFFYYAELTGLSLTNKRWLVSIDYTSTLLMNLRSMYVDMVRYHRNCLQRSSQGQGSRDCHQGLFHQIQVLSEQTTRVIFKGSNQRHLHNHNFLTHNCIIN